MNKVVCISKFGFKLDSLKNDWVKVDKSLLDSLRFVQLKKGDQIDNLVLNNKGFVTSFSSKPFVQSLGVNSSESQVSVMTNSPLLPEASKDIKAREILRGQCLNISMDKLKLIDFKDERARAISNARKLLEEIEAADFYNW